jgi:hypothetical protein
VRTQRQKKELRGKSHALIKVTGDVERLLDQGAGNRAWEVLTRTKFPPEVSEDPRFKALFGYVACLQNPPQLVDARSALWDAIRRGHYPEFPYMRKWFDAERYSGVGYHQALQICDTVLGTRDYSMAEKGEFFSRRGSIYFARACEYQETNTVDAFANFKEAALCHFKGYFLCAEAQTPRADKSAEYARNTCYRYFMYCLSTGEYEQFFSFFDKPDSQTQCYFDPIVDPVGEFFARAGTSQKIRNHRRRFPAKIFELLGRWNAFEASFLEAENFRACERVLRSAGHEWAVIAKST